MDSVLNKHKT